jgi:hypothetical protein
MLQAKRALDDANATDDGYGLADDAYDGDFDEAGDARSFWYACQEAMTTKFDYTTTLQDSLFSLYDQVYTALGNCSYSENRTCGVDVATVNRSMYETLTDARTSAEGVAVATDCLVEGGSGYPALSVRNATFCLPSPDYSGTCDPSYCEYFVAALLSEYAYTYGEANCTLRHAINTSHAATDELTDEDAGELWPICEEAQSYLVDDAELDNSWVMYLEHWNTQLENRCGGSGDCIREGGGEAIYQQFKAACENAGGVFVVTDCSNTYGGTTITKDNMD